MTLLEDSVTRPLDIIRVIREPNGTEDSLKTDGGERKKYGVKRQRLELGNHITFVPRERADDNIHFLACLESDDQGLQHLAGKDWAEALWVAELNHLFGSVPGS